FQAEDGIRDFHVTGVQTCALPIYIHLPYLVPLQGSQPERRGWAVQAGTGLSTRIRGAVPNSVNLIEYDAGGPQRCCLTRWDYLRSEERRVGKEGRARWWGDRGRRK